MRKNKFIALSLALSAFLGTAVPGSAAGPQKQENVSQSKNSVPAHGNSDVKRHENKPLNKKPVANSKKLSLLKWLGGAVVGGLGVNWIANKYGYGLDLFGKKNTDQTPPGANPEIIEQDVRALSSNILLTPTVEQKFGGSGEYSSEDSSEIVKTPFGQSSISEQTPSQVEQPTGFDLAPNRELPYETNSIQFNPLANSTNPPHQVPTNFNDQQQSLNYQPPTNQSATAFIPQQNIFSNSQNQHMSHYGESPVNQIPMSNPYYGRPNQFPINSNYDSPQPPNQFPGNFQNNQQQINGCYQNQHPTTNQFDPSQTPNQPMLPQQIFGNNMQLGGVQNYTFEKQLGSGSFGTVFKAYDNKTNQTVCIKKMYFHNSDFELKELQKESHLWCNFEHPNIVKYYKSFVTDGYFYIVMECIEGCSLEQYLNQRGPLPENEALNLFTQLLSAVKYCHGYETLHRDIKPQNIMITSNGQVKLIDFGIGKPLDDKALTQTQIGTPYYMAPEIFKREEYSYPVDVWSLGCVLYEMVTKTQPFGYNFIYFQNVITNPPFIIQTNVSDQLKELINLMLEKDPVKRITIEKIFKHPAIKSYLMAQQQS